jgi:hypothetical protein
MSNYETKQPDINIVANLDLDNTNANEHIKEVKENLEELAELVEEIELPDVRPIINFYGCSFNFAYDGYAESRYYNGSDIYNQRKEDQNE